MIIPCPECRSDNDARRRFCGACGSTLERLCPCCGFSNRHGDRFCGGCGVRLEQVLAAGAAGAPPAAAAPAAEPQPEPAAEASDALDPTAPEVDVDAAKRDELRTITVMMADIDGFAEMTDVHGRERQTVVMNEVFARLAETHIVTDFDGYIDKFLDGDIMALFGAPIAHEDAPERAMRAAVRMHEELRRLHDEGVVPSDTPLKMRIGLNTGPVRVGGVGAGGRMEYTAMGDTVNLAARLMSAADWGQTLCSVNTHRRVALSFELEELPPVKVKGKSEPVRLWSVVAERRRAARVEIAQSQGMSRLIGREEPLRAIFEAAASARAGQGCAVGITGEAGIGKSRLVFELQRHAAEGGDLRFIEGRCLSYGSNISFLPLRDVLAELFAFDDADSAGAKRQKIREGAAAVGLAPEVAPALGLLLGLDFEDEAFNRLEPQERRQRLRDGVFDLLAASGRRQPLVIFIDDLQWCDPDAREVIDQLVARCPEAPLLLLLAYRSELVTPYPQHPHFTLVQPGPLDLEQTRQVIGSLLHQRKLLDDETRVDDTLAGAVYNKSQGNPFFIDQTVTALLERAEQSGRPTIDFRRGRLLLLEEDLGQLVPDSVEEILLARIDKLPEAPRSLLQAASVAMIGRFFRRSALEFVADDAELGRSLQVLVRRDLVRLVQRTDQDEEYVFEHALARDVAYNALLRSERRKLHGQVGDYIEHHYAASLEAFIDDLSYHFYNSGDARKALEYLPQSAARAARVFSNQQAVLHFKRSLEKADEIGREAPDPHLSRTRIDLLKGLSAVQQLTGDREALDSGRQRLELARQIGDHDAILDASYMLAHQYTELGQFDAARRHWDEVLGEYEQRRAWDGVRDTEYGIGKLLYLEGHYDQALEHFQRGLQIQVEELAFDPFGLWMAHNNLAAAYEAMGRFEDVLSECALCREMLDRFPEDDPLRTRLACYTDGNLGSARRNLGQLEAAVEAYQGTLATAQATGEKNIEAEVRHWLGRTLTSLGRLRAAGEHLDEALALARETGHARWEAGSLAGLAELALLQHDLARADALLGEARSLIERTGPLGGTGTVCVATARLALARGDHEGAVARLETALRQADEDRCDVDRAAVLPDLALAEHHFGRAEQARGHADEGVALAERMGLRETLSRALCVRAELGGDGAEADLDAALAMAREHGLVEVAVAALGLRARRRETGHADAAATAAAAADRAAAAALLDQVAEAAGEGYVKAARSRHLTVLHPQP